MQWLAALRRKTLPAAPSPLGSSTCLLLPTACCMPCASPASASIHLLPKRVPAVSHPPLPTLPPRSLGVNPPCMPSGAQTFCHVVICPNRVSAAAPRTACSQGHRFISCCYCCCSCPPLAALSPQPHLAVQPCPKPSITHGIAATLLPTPDWFHPAIPLPASPPCPIPNAPGVSPSPPLPTRAPALAHPRTRTCTHPGPIAPKAKLSVP